MAVQDRVHVWPCLVDLGMNEALRIDRAAALIDRLAVEIERHDVVLGDEAGRDRRRHQEAISADRVPDADMAESVDDALPVEDAVCGNEVLEERIEIGLRPCG